MDIYCDKKEGVYLLQIIRKICITTGCKDIEHATLAYSEALQEMTIRKEHENSTCLRTE